MPPKEEKRVSARSSSRAADKEDKKLKSRGGGDANNSADTPTSTNGDSNNAATKKTIKKSRPTSRAPQLDPLLLARGMSSRYLSSKLTAAAATNTTNNNNPTNKITPLDKSQIEKDLRHMEAYRNACNGYNQQLFVFNNQELVKSGYFGTFAPGVGSSIGDQLLPGSPSKASTSISSSAAAAAAMTANNNNNKAGAAAATTNFSMPIKIDPEKEKSLALLRKKIHSSEFEREQLETEYLSLRAHYVHESQLVRKTRGYEMARWKFLRMLMERRGRVLSLMRCKVAMARDVERLIGWRGEVLERVRRGELSGLDVGSLIGGDEVEKQKVDGEGVGGSSTQEEKEDAADFIKLWNEVEAKLKEAEAACIELETPKELLQMVKSSGDGDGERGANGTSGGGGGVGGKRRKRSSSIDEGDIHPNGGDTKKKNPIPSGMEPHVIPWDCIVEPQTPYEVPILLSCLSSATDGALGYGKF